MVPWLVPYVRKDGTMAKTVEMFARVNPEIKARVPELLDFYKRPSASSLIEDLLKQAIDYMDSEKKIIPFVKPEVKPVIIEQPFEKKEVRRGWTREGTTLDASVIEHNPKNCPMCGKALVEGEDQDEGYLGCPSGEWKVRKIGGQ